MSAAAINLTINGRPVQAKPGQTVLEAATAAGIAIPTLCHHPALPPHGACRMCLVEIEKQRTLHPACTYPASEGLVVRTETEPVVAARRMNLQLIFSERVHYCMYCPMSGTGEHTDCELQRLAYRYGLTHWTYPPNYGKKWPIDATRRWFFMDHSRCILCRRCVRACAHLAANHTLGVHQRGARTMIGADDNLPFAESTCVSCGTCLQVCPTGALIDRRSAYGGHETDVTRTSTTCTSCPVGCGIVGVTRSNQLLRVEGDWQAPNGGVLCASGRFESLFPDDKRVSQPMIRQNGRLTEVAWEQALAHTAGLLRQPGGVAGLVSPQTMNESLIAFACFFNEILGSDEVSLLHGDVPPLDLGARATLPDVSASDCIVLVGGDPLVSQKVVGYLVRRAVDGGAKLIIVSNAATGLDVRAALRLRLDTIVRASADPFALLGVTHHLRMDGLTKLKEAIEAAERPVILYGGALSTAAHASLRTFPAKVRFLPLVEGANTLGAQRLGIVHRPVRGEALFVLAGEEPSNGTELPAAKNTVVMSARHSRWTEQADVVLPTRLWHEKQGHVVNLEGREMPVSALTQAPPGIHADATVLVMLAAAMGKPLLLAT